MTNETDARSPTETRTVLLPIFAVVVVDTASAGLILPLLPFYAQEFGATPLMIGLLIASFAICELFAGPILGKASDRYGRKRLLLISQIGTCASFLILASAHSLPIVFAGRIVDGLSAGNVAIAIAYVSDRSEPGKRRQAIGVVSAAMGLGTMIGPALGGMLAPIGPAVPFWLAAAVSCASIVLTCALLPADVRTSSGARVWSRVFGTGQPSAAQSHFDEQADVVGAAITPLPSKRFFREISDLVKLPNVKALLTAIALLYMAFSLFSSQLALVLQARYHWGGESFGPTEIGLLFTAAGATNILIQIVVMRAIGSTFHERTVAVASFALLASGFVLIGFGNTIPGLAVGVLAIASGVGLARPTLFAALSLAVPPTSQGVAMGMAQSLASLINIIAPIAGGLLIQQQNFIGWAVALTAIALTGLGAVGLLSMFPKKSASERV
ncbi:MFS transporter [Tardiphaga sp. 862_B3_N4_1]|uniref:MFS transporter n=1 Tax=Tardiphaga sp. 862_B3_N4_1 TaxID=3240764 RepID=UPI003F1F111B